MRHLLILRYQNVPTHHAPMLEYDDAVAVPAVGEEVSYGRNDTCKVIARRFIYSADAVRILLTLDGDGYGEDPMTHIEV